MIYANLHMVIISKHIVCFVDIGGIDDHHCLNFLLIIDHFDEFPFKIYEEF
jgi:hypothetical protein